LRSGRIVGVESLVRWEHPDRGLLLPEDFIPLADETGLIIPVGRYVLGQAFRQARVMQERYPLDPPLRMYVNLSALQFRHGQLAKEIAGILSETGVDPQSVALEITETAIMADTESIVTLQRLKDLGVRVAIDDFGTGYSSLSCL
jgi:EAL domain-containing protein (putative c-di-GMP-specific phosphodiesterase class I)